MTTTDEILAQIDHALEDWEVGPDAMRWTPEPPPEPTPRAGHGRLAEYFDEAFSWGPIVARCAAASTVVEAVAAQFRAERTSAAIERLRAAFHSGSVVWVDIDAIAAEALRGDRSRPADRFTLNDWAIERPASDTQRALIREASE